MYHLQCSNPEQLAARANRLSLSAKGTFLICDIDVDNAGKYHDSQRDKRERIEEMKREEKIRSENKRKGKKRREEQSKGET